MTEPQPDRESHHPDSGQVSLDITGGDTRERAPLGGTGYALLTNRNNLLEILSSGLVKPASLYTKYYPDLGGLYPEAVPLLARDPSSNLVERMVGGEPGAFPVLLDIDLAGMTGSAQAVLAGDYLTERVEIPPREEVVCLLVDGVLPATRVDAVHFRSEEELQEHVARMYENVRADAVPLQVSPKRFRGHRMNVRNMLAALNRTQQATAVLQPDQMARADALGGALLVVAALADRDVRLPLEALRRPLELLHTPTDLPALLEKLDEYPAVDRRIVAAAAAMLTDQEPPELEALAAQLSSGDGNPQHQKDLGADLLAMVAARTLATMSPDDYFAEAALESIREGLEKVLASTAAGDAGTALSRYLTILETVGSVVDNSMDLEDFPAAEVPVATGLLYFLLQSDPVRLMNRASEDRDGDPEALAVAAAFSGALYGRAMIPVGSRPDVGFEQHLDELLVRYLNRANEGLALPAQGSPITETRTVDDNLQEDVLMANDRVLIRRARSPSAPVTAAGDEKVGLTPDPGSREHEELAAVDAPDAAEEVFRRLSTSDLASGPEKEAAIRLCRAAGWNGCVITTMKLERPGAVVTDMPKSEVRIEGFVTPTVGLRTERFRAQLTAEAWAALPEHVRREAEAVLADS